MSDPLDMLDRAAAGDFGAEVLEWLRTGCQAYRRASGAVPMARCLRLPSTPAKHRLRERNRWLARAAQCIDADTPTEAVEALRVELETFLTRGPWRHWRDLAQPPAGTSELRTALFHVAKAADGVMVCGRTIARAAGHVFRQKCPPILATVELTPGAAPGDE